MSIWSSFGRRWVALPDAATAISAIGGAADADVVKVTGAQTVAGVKTFSSIPVLSGGGITFPATQVASADANTLDDYEEGTWTPTLSFGGFAVGMTYTTRTGRYTKIGDIILLNGRIVLSAKGSSTGNAVLSGLPFASVGNNWSFVFSFWNSLASLTDGIQANAAGSSATIYNGGAASTAPLTDANFTNTSFLVFNGVLGAT